MTAAPRRSSMLACSVQRPEPLPASSPPVRFIDWKFAGGHASFFLFPVLTSVPTLRCSSPTETRCPQAHSWFENYDQFLLERDQCLVRVLIRFGKLRVSTERPSWAIEAPSSRLFILFLCTHVRIRSVGSGRNLPQNTVAREGRP